jgi:hypothetical protein
VEETKLIRLLRDFSDEDNNLTMGPEEVQVDG